MNHQNHLTGRRRKKNVFQCLENPCRSLKNIMTRWRRTIPKMNAKQGKCSPLSSLPQALWTGAGSGIGIGQGEEGGGGGGVVVLGRIGNTEWSLSDPDYLLRIKKQQGISQMAPYTLHSSLRLTRALRSALYGYIYIYIVHIGTHPMSHWLAFLLWKCVSPRGMRLCLGNNHQTVKKGPYSNHPVSSFSPQNDVKTAIWTGSHFDLTSAGES